MSRTAAGASLSAAHRDGQVQIRAALVRDYMRIWPLWEGNERSFRRLVEATVPLIRGYHQLSASLASSYYEAFRAAEQVGGQPSPRLAASINEEAVIGTLYVTGRDMTANAIDAGHSPQAAMRNALVRTSGTVSRFGLQGGRDTLVLSSAADRQALGWSRVTGAQPCAFCAMAASRGPVFSEDTADFAAHDHCSCAGEPTYPGSEWPGRAQEFRDLWNEHASGAENPLAEFRRVLSA